MGAVAAFWLQVTTNMTGMHSASEAICLNYCALSAQYDRM